MTFNIIYGKVVTIPAASREESPSIISFLKNLRSHNKRCYITHTFYNNIRVRLEIKKVNSIIVWNERSTILIDHSYVF
jgi:hypothetical protein